MNTPVVASGAAFFRASLFAMPHTEPTDRMGVDAVAPYFKEIVGK